MSEKYADIIIDIVHEKVDRPFQYKIPPHLTEDLEVGMCVQIPFGRGNHLREGYIIGFREETDYPQEKIKEIDSVVTGNVPVEARQLKLAWWIKTWYGSTLIAALKAVLPVKQQMRQQQYREVRLGISPEQARMHLRQAKEKHQMGKVRLFEALPPGAAVSYTMLTGKLAISPQTIRSMANRGILQIDTFQTYRNPVHFDVTGDEKKQLSAMQRQIVEDFLLTYDKGVRSPVLLHGVTGSGKTEVYLQIMEGILQRGRQAIVLIPEIALTYQTVLRFYKRFGDVVSVVNSRLSAGEKYDQFERAKNGQVKIMIGPRSALFTPFPDLGLIIIDEEHENSYKSDSMPKYHAREVAVQLAEMTDACVLLGSATPSMEAEYRARQGVYRRYRLTERIGNATLPEVTLVDLRRELKDGNASIFSRTLQEKIAQRLEKKEQIMLFLNRRGVAGFVSCRACGLVLKCPHCDVSLSEHRNKMICHYCGYETPKVTNCPKCGSRYIFGFKAGTQQVEDRVLQMFPKARVLRMDADTTKKKDDYEKILAAFSNEEADILIGTQMIVKGHDFKNVTLVGVLAADLSLSAADYRAGERTFQLLTQAVGRAGRGEKPGEAVIQTYQPEHYAVDYAVRQDYDGFYEEEYAYRELMAYPPCAHMLAILWQGPGERDVVFYANKFMEMLKAAFPQTISSNRKPPQLTVIGPAPASIGKINDRYRQRAYLKAEDEILLRHAREQLEAYARELAPLLKNIQIFYDFDPMNGY